MLKLVPDATTVQLANCAASMGVVTRADPVILSCFFFFAILHFITYHIKTQVTYITITTYKLQITVPVNIYYHTSDITRNFNMKVGAGIRA